MEQFFFIIYLVSLGIVFAFAYYLIKMIYQEWKLYQLFSENNDIRALMAKDSKRFHISIVYLMTCLTRSNGNNVQMDKIEMIARYIIEVCPLEYQIEAMNALQVLTSRQKRVDKKTYYESIINVKAFAQGNEKFLNKGDNSYTYIYPLDGKSLAEELSLYLSNDDKFYLMYLLFRLTIIDGIITTDGNDSEIKILKELCVKGLKIKSKELNNLINAFATKQDQQWYEAHFSNKDGRYPSSNLLANIFRVDINELISLDKPKSYKSLLGSIQKTILWAGPVYIGLFILFCIYESSLMIEIYPTWIHVIVVILGLLIPFSIIIFIYNLESLVLPILKSKNEIRLHRQGLIASSIISLTLVFSLLWEVSNVSFLIGNEVFCNPQPVEKTAYVTYKGYTKNHYYYKFVNTYIDKEEFDGYNRKYVSFMNRLCLETLSYLPGIKNVGVKVKRSKQKTEVSRKEYNSHVNEIKLYFRLGYFGYVFYDKHKID